MKLWGTRGSLPTPENPVNIYNRIELLLEEFLLFSKMDHAQSMNLVESFLSLKKRCLISGYGGNTICNEITSENQKIIIDCGSGMRSLGNDLLKGPLGQGKGRVDLFITHFHWDHLIGLPFFVPIYIPGNEIHIYAVQEDLEEIIRSLFKKPNFPVPFEELGSQIYFHRLKPREDFSLNNMTVTPYLLDHPDTCWGYRVQVDNKSISHCVDTEAIRVSRKQLGEDLGLYENSDVMVFDAQYSFNDHLEKANWGHSSSFIGIDLALREKIKKVLFVHHDPVASSEHIYKAYQEAKDYCKLQIKQLKKNGQEDAELEVIFAWDGIELEI
tara:strand:+ start:214 stop:1194 length:981 start_codon:yes stop_codon:yes gene_type:complete